MNCNVTELAKEIIDGRRLSGAEDLSFFIDCSLDRLREGADAIRKACVGERVDLCAIINARSGKCSEDCKYCAQSAHYRTNCANYPFLPEKEIVDACKLHEQEGVARFAVVTSGRALIGEEFERALHAFRIMKKECAIGLCASMGFLTAEQLHALHEAGLCKSHFPMRK